MYTHEGSELSLKFQNSEPRPPGPLQPNNNKESSSLTDLNPKKLWVMAGKCTRTIRPRYSSQLKLNRRWTLYYLAFSSIRQYISGEIFALKSRSLARLILGHGTRLFHFCTASHIHCAILSMSVYMKSARKEGRTARQKQSLTTERPC